jgi:glutamine amidotransferase
MADVLLLNSGGSNYTSLQSAFERLGANCLQSSERADIESASHIVLPGVGSASSAMQAIRQQNLAEQIMTLQKPLLGICLGMQILFDASDESKISCLGVIPGNINKLQIMPGFRVPHMGWNNISCTQPNPLFNGIESEDFYFVHSYAAEVNQHTIASCEHGAKFTAAVAYKNFYGVQFHPERSGPQGQKLLANFLSITA